MKNLIRRILLELNETEYKFKKLYNSKIINFLRNTYNIKINKYINSGSNADIYSINNNRVIKILHSKHFSPYNFYNIVNKINSDIFVKIYEMNEFYFKNEKYFYVITEYLTDMCTVNDDVLYSIINNAIDVLDDYGSIGDIHKCNIGKNKRGNYVISDANLFLY